ncbi:PSD1 and planctomycete cytochrome C domain-containing protein [Luteolibacter sp. SL250]|uniref:PSD1 and planctomycete cytochrome C domain-containing protein n=1 Tax=Luteolibacter sp. SL250 TaxID=2995170 RepID=UPI002270CA29|nr:PSD1 and planctomycete cytochrome C domain-containing protein [Luteolibacter sp. SL250]WAC20884.1 PSD1 and planctomycete cytochrome C domain-containing protein [Luteolibacter sp. SL250]
MRFIYLQCLFFLVASYRSSGETDFVHRVVPILHKHCGKCHIGEAKKGGLSLNTRESILNGSKAGEIVTLGRPEESRLMDVILSHDEDIMMPPEGKRLSSQEAAIISEWIKEGMKWEPGIALGTESYTPALKPRRPPIPPGRDGRDHPLDRIIDEYHQARNIQQPRLLSDREFARRLSLDLIGMLPSPEILEAFAKDRNPSKRSELAERFLSDNMGYAEHWISFWNDLLRNDYQGTGYIDGGRTPITEWLYNALLENKPYNQFAKELIAPTTRQSEGFIRGIKWRGRVNASQTTEIQFAQSISQTFLGLNMKCASCHDSFVDNWKLDDAYGLAAIYAETPLEIARCDKPTDRIATPRWIYPELGEVDATASRQERLKQLSGLMTHPENGRFTRTIVNRLWERLLGRGIVHPVDSMDSEPWSEDVLDYLATRFADDGYDLKKSLLFIVSSRTYQSASVPRDKVTHREFRGPIAKRMTAEQFVDAVWTLTGTAPDSPHRSIVRPRDPGRKVRASLVESDPLMRALGRPNREQIVSMRPDNITTLEAIDMANGEILAGLLSKGAIKLSSELQSENEVIESIYLRALSRMPSDIELETLLGLIDKNLSPHTIEDLLWIVLLLPEFQFVR